MPKGLGPEAAAKSFATVFAMTWAGSQVTKLVRAAASLALAPLVDRALTWMVGRFKLRGKGQALAIVATFCISLALAVFGAVVSMWG